METRFKVEVLLRDREHPDWEVFADDGHAEAGLLLYTSDDDDAPLQAAKFAKVAFGEVPPSRLIVTVVAGEEVQGLG